MAKASSSEMPLESSSSCDALSELLELLHEQLRHGLNPNDDEHVRSHRLMRNVERYKRLQAQFEARANVGKKRSEGEEANSKDDEEETEVLYENTSLSNKWAHSIQGDLVPPPLPPRQPRPSAPPPPRRPPSLESSINSNSSPIPNNPSSAFATNPDGIHDDQASVVTAPSRQLGQSSRTATECQQHRLMAPSTTNTMASASQLSAMSKASSNLESELGSLSSSSLCSFVEDPSRPHLDLEALLTKIKSSEVIIFLEALSSTPSNCIQMLSSSAIVFSKLVATLHPSDYDQNDQDQYSRNENRVRAARTLRRIVSAQASVGRKGRRRYKILRLLEQLRMYTDLLKDSIENGQQEGRKRGDKNGSSSNDFALIGCAAVTVITDPHRSNVTCEYVHESEEKQSICVKRFEDPKYFLPFSDAQEAESSHKITLDMKLVLATLAKCSFNDDYNQHVLMLGGVNALADFVMVERCIHFGLDNAFLPPVCADVRHSAVVSLANLAFGRIDVKSYLIHYNDFLEVIKEQLGSNRINIMLNTTHLVRNLAWKIDKDSKKKLSESNLVALMLYLAQLQYEKERKSGLQSYTKALETLLSALWNLSAHSDENKNDMCNGRNLAFLVAMLRHPSIEIVSNVCGILRNLAPFIAANSSQDLRYVLESGECIPLLMANLASSNIQIVSNALNAIYHLSLDCPTTQRLLHELRAESIIGSLIDSRNKSIRHHAQAILENLGTLVDDDIDNLMFESNSNKSVALHRRRQHSSTFVQEEEEEDLFEVKPLKKSIPIGNQPYFRNTVQPLALEMNPMKKQMFVKPNVHLQTSQEEQLPETSLSQQEIQTQEAFHSTNLDDSNSSVMEPTFANDEAPAESMDTEGNVKFNLGNEESQLDDCLEDEPRDFSLRFDDKNDVDDEEDNVIEEATVESETTDPSKFLEDHNVEEDEETDMDGVKTFAIEGTPFAISTATSISDLREQNKKETFIGVSELLSSKPVLPPSGTLTPAASSDRPRIYCTEGTPADIGSRSQCLSPLLSYDEEEEDDAEDEVDNAVEELKEEAKNGDSENENVNDSPEVKIEIATPTHNKCNSHQAASKSVKFGKHLETPLIFSRQSSLESLNSCDSNSIHTGYSSAITMSRTTSRPLSPSELPDSPLESPTLSVRHVGAQEDHLPKTGSPVSDHEVDHMLDYVVVGKGDPDQENPDEDDGVRVFNAGEETPSFGPFSSKTSVGKFDFDDDQLLNSDWMKNTVGSEVEERKSLSVPKDASSGDKGHSVQTGTSNNVNISKRSNDEEEIYAESLIASFSQLGMPKKKGMSTSSRSSSGGRRSRASTSLLQSTSNSFNQKAVSPKANSIIGVTDEVNTNDEDDNNSDCFTDLVALGMPKKHKARLSIEMRGSGDGIPTTKASLNNRSTTTTSVQKALTNHKNRLVTTTNIRGATSCTTSKTKSTEDATKNDDENEEEEEEEEAILDNLVKQGFPKSKQSSKRVVPKALVAPITRTKNEKDCVMGGANSCNNSVSSSVCKETGETDCNTKCESSKDNSISNMVQEASSFNSKENSTFPSSPSLSLLSSTRLDETQTTPLTRAKLQLKEDLEKFRAFRASIPELDSLINKGLAEKDEKVEEDEEDVDESKGKRNRRHDDDERFRTRTIRKADLTCDDNSPTLNVAHESPMSSRRLSDRHQDDRFKTHVIKPEDVRTKNLNPMEMVVVTADDNDENDCNENKKDVTGSNGRGKKGPRILKPTLVALKASEESKSNVSIRGRRKALYQSPSSKGAPGPNRLANIASHETRGRECSNQNPMGKSKASLGPKPSVAPKPQKLFTPLRTPPTPRSVISRNSSPSTKSFVRDSSSASSPRGSTRSTLSNASTSSSRLRRQGTFTKEPTISPGKQVSNRSPKLRKDSVHPERQQRAQRQRSVRSSSTPPKPSTITTSSSRATSRTTPPRSTTSNVATITPPRASNTPPRTTTHSSSSLSLASPQSGSRPKAVTNRLANLWRVKRDRKACSTSFLGRNIPESDLALLKEHAEQKELINKHKKKSSNSGSSINQDEQSSDQQPFVHGHKSRLSLRLSKLAARSSKRELNRSLGEDKSVNESLHDDSKPDEKSNNDVSNDKTCNESTCSNVDVKNEEKQINATHDETKDDNNKDDMYLDAKVKTAIPSDRRASTMTRLSSIGKPVRRNDSYMTSMGRKGDLVSFNKKITDDKESDVGTTATPV